MIASDIALVWICMLLFHELGHFFILRKLRGRDVEIRFYYHTLRDAGFKVGKPEHYSGLSIKQNISISILGIIAGFIPLLIYGFLQNSFIHFIVCLALMIVYCVGCYPDLRKARRLRVWAKKMNHPLNKPL